MEADKDRDGKISFDEFTKMVENTDVSMSMTLGMSYQIQSKLPAPLHCLEVQHTNTCVCRRPILMI